MALNMGDNMSIEQRHTGHYWVHLKTNYCDEWTVGYFDGTEWQLIGQEDYFRTKEFAEIGDRIEK